ncbi:hypothetical protein AwDysgo_00200 [Bacteroidales bacterium]|nr:hypothetical protein AwDysgo_00200 [Bacteroidales bacterium]
MNIEDADTSKDILKDIFIGLELESASDKFEVDLMQKIFLIHQVQKQKRARRGRIISYVSFALAILAILLIPFFVYNYFEVKVDLNFSHIYFNPSLIGVALSILFLLIVDCIISTRGRVQ